MKGKTTFKQLEMESILEHSFKQRVKAIDCYITKNVLLYHGNATLIKPNFNDWESVWDRVAFSILSANCHFDKAVKALGYATSCKGFADSKVMLQWGMVPAKADYLNALPGPELINGLLKKEYETWHEYRIRLSKNVKGLGLAKASFAACLLYPTEADLACVDTWIQKVFMNQTFKELGIKNYCKVETKIRRIAQRHGINTFLAQWMIWDHTRKVMTDHSIFPGSHKDIEVDPPF